MPERSRPAVSSDVAPEQSPAWLGIAIGLLVARWLMPAESTASGATLWLVTGWLLLAMIWSLSRLRRWPLSPLRFDRIDLAVTLLVTPQIVSAACLLATGDGNGRAAANMACEWISLLLAFVLLRRWFSKSTDFQALARVILAVVVSLSVLGIWQHHVGYRRAIASFKALQDELDTAVRTRDISTARQLRAELAAAGVPFEGPARQLWERRLRDSREPYALFALANSPGGLLAPLLIFGLGLLPAWKHSAWSEPDRGGFFGRLSTAAFFLVAGFLLISYCLLLTKSRTAWSGFAAGGVLLVGGQAMRWIRERPGRLALGASVPVLLVAVAFWTGGIDREVFTEAPKSLSYRFEYWKGTLGVIADRPLMGTGPGNFRQHYLAHKLEESSEEITDPHNFLLEATATSGLIGLAGLIACVGLFLAGHHQHDTASAANIGEQGDRGAPTGIIALGGVFGFVLAMAPGWLLDGGLDTRLACVAAGFIVSWTCLPSARPDRLIQRRATLAALVTLLVHLLGAGGFSRPALMQLALLLVVGWRPWPNRDHISNSAPSLGPARLAVLGCGVLLLLVTLLAVNPVFRSSIAVQQSDNALLLRNRPEEAARLLHDAQQADRLDPAPSRRLARLRIENAVRDPASDEVFDQAIHAAIETSLRDPHNWVSAHDRARAVRLKWQRHRDDDVARKEMINWGTAAVDHYPSNPRLHAWLAETLAETGQVSRAAREARQTIRLHRLLQSRGHVDKLLSRERLAQMRALEQAATEEGNLPRGRN